MDWEFLHEDKISQMKSWGGVTFLDASQLFVITRISDIARFETAVTGQRNSRGYSIMKCFFLRMSDRNPKKWFEK